MASYNTVITNEGAALLASVIANQGTLTFSEMRFSTTDYDGVEATLTVGTFAGVFITAAASASVVDSTTIKVDAQFDNSGIVGDHPLYSIGIVGTDGNTTALIAVCTTTNPDIIRAALTGVSTYAFNVNLTVSSTSNITVVGTTAAVLYDTDTVNHLNSTDTKAPLSAYMGKVLRDNLVNENLVDNAYFVGGGSQQGGQQYPINNRGKTTYNTSGLTIDRWRLHSGGSFELLSNGLSNSNVGTFWMTQYLSDEKIEIGETYTVSAIVNGQIVEATGIIADTSTIIIATINTNEGSFSLHHSAQGWYVSLIGYSTAHLWTAVKVEKGSVSTIANDVPRPYAIELARCQTSTAEPGDTEANKGNLVKYADLTSLYLTGTTNTTGSTINAETYFYLNGTLCKAIQDIGINNPFTEGTNYRKSSGLANEIITQSPTVDTTKMPTGIVYCYTYGKICMLRIEGATFANDGDGQVVMSNLPKAITLMQGVIGGSSSADTAAINSTGTVAWIQGTNLCVSVGTGDANRQHYIYVVYITV